MRKTRCVGPITKEEILGHSRRDPRTNCIEWLGASQGGGYGVLRRDGKNFCVTRLMVHFERGLALDSSLNVLHRCDNPKCINIKHLFVGTGQDNMTDKVQKHRHSHGETHPLRKLSERDVKAIRYLAKYGVKRKVIAKAFAVCYANVSHILNDRLWKHI